MSDAIPTDQRQSRIYDDVDKGFAWFVLIGCFVINLFVVGSFKAYGVLYTEMVEYYYSGFGNTAWIGSIAMILLFGLGPVANLLCKIYTFRRITIIGGVLIGIGYFLSGFVTRIVFMYLTFLCAGLGYGLTYAPCTTIISFYFDKRRALANGIAVSGSSVGAIALPFLYKYLIEHYGLNGTFWLIGAVFANVCVAGCIFRQPRFIVEEQRLGAITANTTSDVNQIGDSQLQSGRNGLNIFQKINKRLCLALDLRFSLFKNALFTLYVISFICCAFAYTGSFILIPASVKVLGYDKTYVALSVTIFGGVEIFARILIGWFADLDIIQRKYIYVFSMFIGGVFSLVAPLFETFSYIAVYAAITAIFPGSYFSLISVLIIDIVGLENFSPAFGLLTLSLAVGTVPSQPAIGWLYDLYGNWHLSFILTGCAYILAGGFILLEPIVFRCCNKTDKYEFGSSDNQQQRQNDDRSAYRACQDNFESTETMTSFTS